MVSGEGSAQLIIFILQTLLKQTRKREQKLCCCFVDFKKAFDSIPRQQLWEVLQAKGVSGQFLTA